MTGVQMCTVDDIIGGRPCLRVAQHEWHPDADGHPVFLCNYHAEPLLAAAGPRLAPGSTPENPRYYLNTFDEDAEIGQDT